MNKVPISIIIDDSAPAISVFYEHHTPSFTDDGRPLMKTYSNEFLFEFCDIVQKYGARGKFSVVPMPGNKGDIVNGIDGVEEGLVEEWLDNVKTRLVPGFSIVPEMLSHNKAVDLKTGKALDEREDEWSNKQDCATLTPYIAKGISLLTQRGFDICGVTSPWYFGIKVEDEYVKAISKAMFDVTGKKNAWYFLRYRLDTPNAKPWVAYDKDGHCVVSVPTTTRDYMRQTIDSTRTDQDYINEIADNLITADGTEGEIIRVLESGGYPVLLTHWQNLISNGLGTGLKVLEEVLKRISQFLLHRVQWMSAEEIMNLVLENKEAYPKPSDF